MIFLMYTISVILQQYKGMTTEVPDPCPSNIVENIVADMCKSNTATEESSSGGYKVDSVVLRIMTQQDNCICRVTIDNQIHTVVVGLRKYDGFTSSAPEKAACGLAVDINHIPDMSTGNVIAPIECLVDSTIRNIPLLQNSILQFKSRIINGNFTRGYCMRIQRDINSNHSQVLRIDCDAPTTTEHTTNQTMTSDPMTTQQTTRQKIKSDTTTDNSGMTTEVPDPCPSNIVENIVADMCKSSSATEETISGGYKVDSVVLRIMTQQDNCTCRVTIDNQIEPISTGLNKFGGLTLSAPVNADCGLAVDINHIPDMSTGNAIAPIECIVDSIILNIPLLQKSILQFKSRIINGNFTRGYCMRIQRDINSNHSQVLRIDCDAPTTTEHTTNQTMTSDPMTTQQTTRQKIKSDTTTDNSGMTTEVPDPCPSTIRDNMVADMCKSSSATEETISGGYKVDSVVLRIMTQQDKCICRVTIDNQIKPVVVGLRKYDGLTASAPVKTDCGLAVDINHIPDMSTGNTTAPIECIVDSIILNIPLLQKSILQFKSRIINGNFTRGYCMRIQRDINSDHSQVLRIDCDAPTTTEHTTNQTITSDPMTTQQTTRQKIKSDTTTDNSENVNTAYMVVSACSSTVAVILLVVLVITCIRNKSRQNVNRPNGNVNNFNHQAEYNKHYCDLTNNVPNVTGQEYDIIDSNYNTIDDDRSQPSNNVVVMEGEYTSVEPDGHLTTTMN